MQAAWLNLAQVWATTGRPATSRKSLSTFGPMRVPLPAATMMAETMLPMLNRGTRGQKSKVWHGYQRGIEDRGCVRSTSRSRSEWRLVSNFQPAVRLQRAPTGPTDTVAVRDGRCVQRTNRRVCGPGTLTISLVRNGRPNPYKGGR